MLKLPFRAPLSLAGLRGVARRKGGAEEGFAPEDETGARRGGRALPREQAAPREGVERPQAEQGGQGAGGGVRAALPRGGEGGRG